MNTVRVIREVPADGVQVEAVSILKFLIFRLIDLNVTVLCFDQQIASGASVAFQSFFMDAVTLLDCRDHVGGLSLGPVVSVRVAVCAVKQDNEFIAVFDRFRHFDFPPYFVFK